MNNDLVNLIKREITCSDFAGKIGLEVNRAGFCCCPFHAEKTPSMKIYKDTNSFYCFACHAGGDVITMAKLYYKVGFSEAIKILAEQFGLHSSEDAHTSRENSLRMAVEDAKRKSLAEKQKRFRDAVEAEYWIWFERWLDRERAIAEYAPKSMNEEFDEKFVKALRERTEIKHNLEIAEMRRASFYGSK